MVSDHLAPILCNILSVIIAIFQLTKPNWVTSVARMSKVFQLKTLAFFMKTKNLPICNTGKRNFQNNKWFWCFNHFRFVFPPHFHLFTECTEGGFEYNEILNFQVNDFVVAKSDPLSMTIREYIQFFSCRFQYYIFFPTYFSVRLFILLPFIFSSPSNILI